MIDVSGYGLRVRIIASTTFPVGFDVSQFADDGDPFDTPKHKIGDANMGLNGDLITYRSANPIPLTLTVIPGGEDDLNLSILYEANRVGKGKQSAADEITITAIYNDGSTYTYTGGTITDGMPGQSLGANGRKKSKSFDFMFENRVQTS